MKNEIDNLCALSAALDLASDYGLEDETILWAMYALKDDNTLSIKEAFDIALAEWIK